jgi:hypothetical protein
MARTKTVTQEALAALGAEALAELLIAHAATDPTLRKKLGMLLAGTEGPGKLAAEIDKRIKTIGRSRSIVDWEKRKPLVQELDHLRVTMATRLARQDAARAVELLWDFIGIADAVMQRVGEGIGEVEDVFGTAMEDLGRLSAAEPRGDAKALARRVLAYCERDGFGATDALIRHMSEALGAGGRAEIRRATEGALKTAPRSSGPQDWRADAKRRHLAFRLALLADLEKDADAFIAAIRAGAMESTHALEVAERLITANRSAGLADEDGRGAVGRRIADLRQHRRRQRTHRRAGDGAVEPAYPPSGTLGTLAEIRAMLEASQVLAEDPSKPAAPDDIVATIGHFRELTRIAEHERHEAVLSCTRARRQMLAALPARRPMQH